MRESRCRRRTTSGRLRLSRAHRHGARGTRRGWGAGCLGCDRRQFSGRRQRCGQGASRNATRTRGRSRRDRPRISVASLCRWRSGQRPVDRCEVQGDLRFETDQSNHRNRRAWRYASDTRSGRRCAGCRRGFREDLDRAGAASARRPRQRRSSWKRCANAAEAASRFPAGSGHWPEPASTSSSPTGSAARPGRHARHSGSVPVRSSKMRAPAIEAPTSRRERACHSRTRPATSSSRPSRHHCSRECHRSRVRQRDECARRRRRRSRRVRPGVAAASSNSAM